MALCLISEEGNPGAIEFRKQAKWELTGKLQKPVWAKHSYKISDIYLNILNQELIKHETINIYGYLGKTHTKDYEEIIKGRKGQTHGLYDGRIWLKYKVTKFDRNEAKNTGSIGSRVVKITKLKSPYYLSNFERYFKKGKYYDKDHQYVALAKQFLFAVDPER